MASNIALTNTNGFTSNLLTTTGTVGSSPVTSTVNGGNNNNSKKQIFVRVSFLFPPLYLHIH